MALKPWEFGRLTPGELYELIDGWEEREEHERQNLAWLAATIINGVGWRKRAVKMEDLLPKKGEAVTIEQCQQELEEKRQRFEAARNKRLKLAVNNTRHG